tara:strand:- start:8058 stop:9854 length:1797 start_codon:yes stop_codon:yes gene_type:complete
MTYKVLSLKWRPQTFDDVIGQDHITKTLKNAFALDRVAQGYMFSGPRGVGKTTTARIMAMALNATGGPKSNFDNNSENSKEIAEGRYIDVLEIDGASNRGIDEIRNLREQIKFAPMNGQYKVIIIDEVHMLTNQAFNALLRTLEEPPPHGKFIFCTTDIHKVPATIISRCQRFDFNRLSVDDIIKRLKYILDAENKKYDNESLIVIANKADGSMRDSLSLLDQAISYCGDEIKHEKIIEALGIISDKLFFDFVKSIRNKDYNLIIKTIEKFANYGVPASEVISDLGTHVRNLIYTIVAGTKVLTNMGKEKKELYAMEAQKWDRRDLLMIAQMLSDVSSSIRFSAEPYLLIEMTALKLLELDSMISIEELLAESQNTSVNESEKIEHKNQSSSLVDHKQKETEKLRVGKQNLDIGKPDSNFEDGNADERDSQSDIKKVQLRNEINDSRKISSNVLKDHKAEKHKSALDSNELPKETLTIEAINNQWERIIDLIHKKKPSLGSVIEGCKPLSINGSILKIQTVGKSEFNLKTLGKGAPIIEQIIYDLLNFQPNIKFTTESFSDKSLKKEINKNNQKTSDGSNEEETLDRIVDLFDGEILN